MTCPSFCSLSVVHLSPDTRAKRHRYSLEELHVAFFEQHFPTSSLIGRNGTPGFALSSLFSSTTAALTGFTNLTRAVPIRKQVLADFARQPTTYVVVGVEDVGLSTTTTTGSTAAAQPSVSNSPKTAPRRRSSGTISPGGGGFGAAVRHPMKWQMTESALKPAPRIWTGL